MNRFESFAFFLTIALAPPSAAWSETQEELSASGYEIIWSGYASITTCVHGDDAYPLGPFLFVCDKYSYEYPYHYGDTSILARAYVYEGQTFVSSFICLEPDEDCIEGSLYRR